MPVGRISPTLISQVLLVSLLGALCGCGSGGNSGPTVTGVVFIGDKAAVANPVGADGLTLAPVGTAVNVFYNDRNATYQANSPKVDSQGRFTFHMQHTDVEYYVAIANTCSTVAGIELGPGDQIDTINDPSFTNGHTPSSSMTQKAAAAASALGVNVVVIIGTDSDSCRR